MSNLLPVLSIYICSYSRFTTQPLRMIPLVADIIEKCLYDQNRELYLNQSQINGRKETNDYKITNLFQHYCLSTKQVTII